MGRPFLPRPARTVQPAFTLDDTTHPQIAAICARVGGMPLAIELAAGWADTLSLAEIAAELERGDELLTSTASDVPAGLSTAPIGCPLAWKVSRGPLVTKTLPAR